MIFFFSFYRNGRAHFEVKTNRHENEWRVRIHVYWLDGLVVVYEGQRSMVSAGRHNRGSDLIFVFFFFFLCFAYFVWFFLSLLKKKSCLGVEFELKKENNDGRRGARWGRVVVAEYKRR